MTRNELFAEAADSLSKANLVGWRKMFRVYARVTGGDRNIKPGTYLLRHGTPWKDIVAALHGGHGLVNTITIPEGYTLSQIVPLLGKTLFAPGAWIMLYRGGKLAGFPAAGVSPEQSAAERNFPVLLICDEADTTLPCRHSKKIYAAARGPKSLWMVPGAFHTAALGFAPEEFQRRVLEFFWRAEKVPRS